MWYKKTTACSTGVRSQSIKIPQITVQNKQNRRPVTAKKVFFYQIGHRLQHSLSALEAEKGISGYRDTQDTLARISDTQAGKCKEIS